MRRALAVCACSLMACGRAPSVEGSPWDAGPWSEAGADAADLDSSVSWFASDAALPPAVDAGGPFTGTFEDCDGGCPSGDYCIASHFFGGGRLPLGVAPIGCNAIPVACQSDPTCVCLLAQPDVGPCKGDCIVDDAGTPVLRCLIARP